MVTVNELCECVTNTIRTMGAKDLIVVSCDIDEFVATAPEFEEDVLFWEEEAPEIIASALAMEFDDEIESIQVLVNGDVLSLTFNLQEDM